jgi:hypothetical protein
MICFKSDNKNNKINPSYGGITSERAQNCLQQRADSWKSAIKKDGHNPPCLYTGAELILNHINQLKNGGYYENVKINTANGALTPLSGFCPCYGCDCTIIEMHRYG